MNTVTTANALDAYNRTKAMMHAHIDEKFRKKRNKDLVFG